MFSTRFSRSWRPFAYCLAVTIFAATLVSIINSNNTSATASAQDGPTVEAPAATFPGTGVGPIPDQGTFTTCGNFVAAPLDISFAASGMSAPLTDVGVSFTFGVTHTWRNDLRVTLISPGGTAQKVIFSQTGATTPTGCGSGSLLTGPYTFSDTAPAAPTWWAVTGSPSPSGSYRASTPGGVVGGGANTTITPAFAALTDPQINGSWTLRIEDGGGGDTGSISAATLTLVGATGPTPTPTPTPTATPTPPDTWADFDGDGSTDYTVIRNAGGPSGQATWYVSLNATSIPSSRDWGVASDQFVTADYDGDGKDDYAVWRSGAQGTFYIVNSGNNTITVDPFGTAGDDPSIVADYNKDGKDDIAVYRAGATVGAQSFWYWKSGGTIFAADWGEGGDFVAPGDYNGDGVSDYAIQRPTGGNGVFWIRVGNGPDQIITFGSAGDVVVNADYDGDKKTDLAVMTPSGSQWAWIYRPSLGGPDVANTWGVLATDIPAPGDYNGDGKSDFAVWRPGALSTFYVMRLVTWEISSRQWGFIDDTPATLTYAH